MIAKPIMSQDEIAHILSAAKQEALRNHWNVTIAIVDDGGHPLALERMDECAPIAAYIAMEKAKSAALGKRPSADYENMINGGRTAFLSAPNLAGMLEGGTPITIGKHTIGAIGVSGVQKDQDAQIAQAGASSINKLPASETWNAANPFFR